MVIPCEHFCEYFEVSLGDSLGLMNWDNLDSIRERCAEERVRVKNERGIDVACGLAALAITPEFVEREIYASS